MSGRLLGIKMFTGQQYKNIYKPFLIANKQAVCFCFFKSKPSNQTVTAQTEMHSAYFISLHLIFSLGFRDVLNNKVKNQEIIACLTSTSNSREG